MALARNNHVGKHHLLAWRGAVQRDPDTVKRIPGARSGLRSSGDAFSVAMEPPAAASSMVCGNAPALPKPSASATQNKCEHAELDS